MKLWLFIVLVLTTSIYSYADTQCVDESINYSERTSADVEAWLKLDLQKNERLVIKFNSTIAADEVIALFESAAEKALDLDAQVLVILEKRYKIAVYANQNTIWFLLKDPRIISVSFDQQHGGGQSGSSVGN